MYEFFYLLKIKSNYKNKTFQLLIFAANGIRYLKSSTLRVLTSTVQNCRATVFSNNTRQNINNILCTKVMVYFFYIFLPVWQIFIQQFLPHEDKNQTK